MTAKLATKGTQILVPRRLEPELSRTIESSQHFIFNKLLIYKGYWTRNYITDLETPSIDLYEKGSSEVPSSTPFRAVPTGGAA